MASATRVKIGHFGHMGAPDHPAIAGERGTVGAIDTDDATEAILPNDFATRR
jgi:hypothetical protein